MASQSLVNDIEASFKLVFEEFINLEHRIHFAYLLSAIVMGFYVYKKRNKNSGFFRFMFPKQNYISKSAITDYLFIFFNAFVKVAVLFGLIYWGKSIHLQVDDWLLENFGLPERNISITKLAIAYTIVFLLINDFTYYLFHWLFHKIPLLWEFHKVHHSATVLNPITQYRIHPVELIVNNSRLILLLSVMNGVFDYLSESNYGPVTYLGVNITVLLFNFWGANLRHSHVKLTYFDWLEKYLISPFQHQIHHSNNPKLFNKNMGSKLAIWDRLFGTLVTSEEVEELAVGLGKEDEEYDSFFKNLLLPFKKVLWDSWRR